MAERQEMPSYVYVIVRSRILMRARKRTQRGIMQTFRFACGGDCLPKSPRLGWAFTPVWIVMPRVPPAVELRAESLR